MITVKAITDSTPLNEEISRVLTRMTGIDPETNEYVTMTDQLRKLYALKEIDAHLELKQTEAETKQKESEANLKLKEADLELKQKESEANLKLKEADLELKQKDADRILRLKPETLAVIGGNLVGLVAILGYEQTRIVTSKALGFVMKLAR